MNFTPILLKNCRRTCSASNRWIVASSTTTTSTGCNTAAPSSLNEVPASSENLRNPTWLEAPSTNVEKNGSIKSKKKRQSQICRFMKVLWPVDPLVHDHVSYSLPPIKQIRLHNMSSKHFNGVFDTLKLALILDITPLGITRVSESAPFSITGLPRTGSPRLVLSQIEICTLAC